MKIKEKIKAFAEERTQVGVSVRQREARLSKVMDQAQVLREELFKRDTESIKRNREAIHYEGAIEKMKANLTAAEEANKTLEATVLGDLKKTMDERDKEIEVLRGMLETSKAEIRARDVEIAGYNRRAQRK